MSLDSEAELIARCRRGDAAAWSELFDQQYGSTARFIFQLSPDFTPEDVEEVCQEVSLLVVRNLNSFSGRSRLQTWIFRIALNRSRDYRTRQCALKRGGGQAALSLQAEDPETGLCLDPPGDGPGPDEALLRSEKLALVARALGQLSRTCREIVALRYFGGLSYEEIGRELKLNPKTVGSHLSKSLDRLAVVLGRWLAREEGAGVPAPAYAAFLTKECGQDGPVPDRGRPRPLSVTGGPSWTVSGLADGR
jgi:RNA polymerase sigma-70 factor, ECF subfamily